MAEIPNFPGNSNKSKQLKAEQEEKNLKPIVSQPAVKRKKSPIVSLIIFSTMYLFQHLRTPSAI